MAGKKKVTSEKSNTKELKEQKTGSKDTGENIQEELMKRMGTWEDLYREMFGTRIYDISPSDYENIYEPLNVPEELGLDGYGFGDEYFIFEDTQGSPKYQEENEIWENFIKWIEAIRERIRSDKEFQESEEYSLGEEIIREAKCRNAFYVYLIIRQSWVCFRDTYLLTEDCPEYILEFVRGIMFEKMTEKQMWGTDEDRMPEGTLILLDKSLMSKDGENIGKLKCEYRPDYVQEMQEAMRNGKIK